ncbi:MAG: hypothetical protein WBA38_10870 [Gordonia sp. (in: high G+C Gram-positive bacteria)]|uniref:hypothetical protein n=1 Tax=Gordonia sp. (in: high G+C Gram-positive bacteria) TaxID=84139 RepID=UPI003C75A6E7
MNTIIMSDSRVPSGALVLASTAFSILVELPPRHMPPSLRILLVSGLPHRIRENEKDGSQMTNHWSEIVTDLAYELRDLAQLECGDDWDSVVEYYHRGLGVINQTDRVFTSETVTGLLKNLTQARGIQRRLSKHIKAEAINESWHTVIITVWRDPVDVDVRFINDADEARRLDDLIYDLDRSKINEALRPPARDIDGGSFQ